METAQSTVTGAPDGRPAGLRRAARIVGGGRTPPSEVAALLLPMVRRAVRTRRGPVALVCWLGRCPVAPAADPAAQLADGLARLLSVPTGSPADTLAVRASAIRPAHTPDTT